MQDPGTSEAAACPRKKAGGPPEFVPSFKHRIPGLDELRGLAILFVMVDHSIILWAGFTSLDFLGTLGVNIFFIISGYLICSILKNTRGAPNFFRAFYIRRIFRIWPLFLLVTLFGFLVGLHYRQAVWKALPYYLTFTMNIAVEKAGEAAAAGEAQSWLIPFTSPMWSLAIEEQFYLFLPLLVCLFNPKRLPLIVGAICFLSALGSLLFLHWYFPGDTTWAYPNFKNTLVRVHYLGFGVLLALQPRLAYGVILAWLGVSVLAFHGSGIMEIAIALALVWVIDRTLRKKPLIRNRFLARAGFLCYGLYLIHWVIARSLEKGLLPHLGASAISTWMVFVFYLGISFIAAHWSFEYFENPIQKLRTRFE